MSPAASALAFAALALAAGCSRGSRADPAVHSLRLPDERAELPEGAGRAAVVASCVACHSPRYVLDQPFLPRRTWKAEVEKMRAAYGAPVAPADVEAIVSYLAAVHGDKT